MEDSRGGHHPYSSSQGHGHSSDRYPNHSSSSSSQQHYQQQQQHPSSSYPREGGRSHPRQHPQDPDAGAAWRSPITPTTTHRFNKMAIHEVIDSHHQQQQHPYGYEEDSPPYKRKGSPEEFSFSDPPASSSGSHGGSGSHQSRHFGRGDSHHQQEYHRPLSPRYRHESPLPGSNSEDEDDDIRNYKKRRFPGISGQKGGPHQSPPSSSPGGQQPEVMDQVRSTLKLKQQQKAIIESRQQGQPSPLPQSGNGKPSSSNGANPPVTETSASGLSVFHGSSSFASLNRRPEPSPKNPKNAKSLTIFAPSYSDSTLSIQSAPLQPSQSHQAMSMGLRTSQPLRNQHHPYAPQPSSLQQPLRSPRTTGHNKKPSRSALRPPGTSADSSSGTIPAPILSSHTGPLPSPMYPPSTPFLSNPKHMFMETVSNLFDSVDSSRSLKYTLEEQIRKSAQLLQTLQASGTMIENLVRGQFKELEKGVIDRFESEIEHLNARVQQLEEHQGLTPPPKKPRTLVKETKSTATPPTSSAMTGVTSTSNGTIDTASSGAAEASNDPTSAMTPTQRSSSSPNSGTLPTPPLTKNQDSVSAMEIEDEEERESSEYGSSVQEHVTNAENRK
ncbi:hypothetical protein BGX27_000536 [Mortierella sp. AM989]|nr:hypothetical protein BGX27_000536 [Mortierella sp. AM989]